MHSRETRLSTAILSAKAHLSAVAESSSNNAAVKDNSTMRANSKLARLTGKVKENSQRKPLLSRVGVRNRPTYDLIADGILGRDSADYQPKLSMQNKSNETVNSVAERINNLRERTLAKISADKSDGDDTFFGFESDGTPIWSSLVTGERNIAARVHQRHSQVEMNHHTIHIPTPVDWPKQLQFNDHNNFKSWFTVTENKRATQLAEQVIDYPRQGTNPFVIIGDAESGKSHLLNAIGQAMLIRNDHLIYYVHGGELTEILSQQCDWTEVFSPASMLIIDDIDSILLDDEVANKWGTVIDVALNMNAHVIVSSKSLPDNWPASRLWDVLRSGVKTILNPVGVGSLMLYARSLAVRKSMVLTDEQLALIATFNHRGWRSTRNAIDKIESALRNGVELSDTVDVQNLLNDIIPERDLIDSNYETESVESVAERLINSVTDVVYSDQELGGIEFNTELPELSDDYQPPELAQLLDGLRDRDLVNDYVDSTLATLTPEAPSVIDVADSDRHLIAKMNRIVERDHSIAADILTDLDVGIDARIDQSNSQIFADADVLTNLESKLLNLAERTSAASIEGLIDIADELRELESELMFVGNATSLEQVPIDSLDSYTPDSDWNIDASAVSVEELTEDETIMIPIMGVLEPHPEGIIRTSTITPVDKMQSGEEE